MNSRYRIAPVMLAAAFISSPIAAQSATSLDTLIATDPTTVTAPSLDFPHDKDAQSTYWKYFIFHKDGVDFRTAVADVSECESYSKINDMFVPVPELVPYGTPSTNPASAQQDRRYQAKSTQFGVAGLLLGGLASSYTLGPVLRRLYNTNQRNCMGFKGYKPYGVTEQIAKAIEGGTIQQRILIKAKIASNPIPALEESQP
jgi:hypothetical protein